MAEEDRLVQGTILTTDVVSQLHSIGGMEEWEVYVAMHLPDLPEAPHSREQLVRALLMRGAPLWQGQENKQDFLKGLGFPWAWFLEAMAIHARATGDKTGDTNPAIQISVTLLINFIKGRQSFYCLQGGER